MFLLNRLVEHRLGSIAVLTLAAFLESWGDSCFQSGFYRASGSNRIPWLLAGTGVLALYGGLVNLPRWDFGRLLGVYVVLFFIAVQTVAKFRFGQSPTPAIYLGGTLVVIGGVVMAFWKP